MIQTTGENSLQLWINTTFVAAATAVITPFIIKFILAGLTATITSSVGLIVGGAAIVIFTGLAVNMAAEYLGIKQVLYDFLVKSDMAAYYKEQAETDPEWVPWYF